MPPLMSTPLCRRRPAGATAVLCALLVAVLALHLGGCGGGAGASNPPAPLPAVPSVTPGTWVVLGSSTAAGVGAGPRQGWVARLSAQAATLPAAPVSLVNLARAGAVTYQALPSASTPPAGRPGPDPAANIDLALAQSPRLVFIAYPTNDTVLGYTADETVANLQRLRAVTAGAGAVALLLSTQPRDGLTAAQRATLDEIDRGGASAFGPCFVPLRAALSGADGGIAAAYAAGDGVHLNDAGHQLVAQRVWALLDSGRCVRLGGA